MEPSWSRTQSKEQEVTPAMWLAMNAQRGVRSCATSVSNQRAVGIWTARNLGPRGGEMITRFVTAVKMTNTREEVSTNKRKPTNKGEAAPFPMLINMRTRNDEADLTPQELFTPIAQEPSPYTAWRAPPCPKADTKLTTTRRRHDA